MLKKKGAIELSIGTIVIIVLAMSMLILGLVLVKTIFSGAKYNIEQMNEKVTGEINKLFVEEKRAVIYLSNKLAEIKQGEQWGIAFGVYNTGETQDFTYEIIADDPDVNEKCGVSETDAERWISAGREGTLPTPSGEKIYETIRFNIPENAVNDISKCLVRYRLKIFKENNDLYTSQSFDIDVN